MVGTSVATVYARSPITANSGVRTIEAAFPDRFVFGLGVSHEPMVEGMHHTEYGPPLATMRKYLDAMDAAPFMAYGGGTKPKRVLAALGPKMLALSAERADGANPYNVTPDHTKHAREILGPDKLLIVEQMAVLSTDREAALAVRAPSARDLSDVAELREQLAPPGLRRRRLRRRWQRRDSSTRRWSVATKP